MKPNTSNRKYHVKQKLAILRDLGIKRPEQDVIEFCMDEERCTDIQCDNIFLDYTLNAQQNAKPYRGTGRPAGAKDMTPRKRRQAI